MAVRQPLVRHFLACKRVEVPPDGKHVTLHDLIQSISLRSGATFPHIQPEIDLYVVLTDGDGKHTFEIELVGWNERGEEDSLYRTPATVVDLGADPLAVRGWPIRLHNLLFPRAGQYEFRLWCEGAVLAHEAIVWKETP